MAISALSGNSRHLASTSAFFMERPRPLALTCALVLAACLWPNSHRPSASAVMRIDLHLRLIYVQMYKCR